MDVRVEGGTQLRRVGRGLRTAAGGRVIRKEMRAAIVSSVKPMKTAVQRNARAIPARGPRSTGLRGAIAGATQTSVKASGSTAVVKLWVNPARMPAGQKGLPRLMEGDRKWRHPLFGNAGHWYSQPSHRYFAPAVQPRIAGVRVAVMAAVARAAAEIEREL